MDETGPYLTVDDLPEPLRSMIRRLDDYADHPARALFEKTGNGVFEDDYSTGLLPGPWLMYRFRREYQTAYVWERDGLWHVRRWSDMRRSKAGRIQTVESLGVALDCLTRPRRWWQFWK